MYDDNDNDDDDDCPKFRRGMVDVHLPFHCRNNGVSGTSCCNSNLLFDFSMNNLSASSSFVNVAFCFSGSGGITTFVGSGARGRVVSSLCPRQRVPLSTVRAAISTNPSLKHRSKVGVNGCQCIYKCSGWTCWVYLRRFQKEILQFAIRNDVIGVTVELLKERA